MSKQNKKRKNLLSVIIPCYRQGPTIQADLRDIERALDEGLPVDYDYEIIVVEDGQVDNTSKEVKKVNSRKIKLISRKQNLGKGYTVREGMQHSRGDLISFIDAGREIHPKGIMMLMAHMEWYDADIVVGSKRHPASRVSYPFTRRLISVGYYLLVRSLFGIKVRDTQSGIKIFKRSVIKKILKRLVVKQYAMDVEMLAVANKLGFTKIYEAPIEIRYGFEGLTKASTTRNIYKMLVDTVAVFYRMYILRYYEKDHASHGAKKKNKLNHSVLVKNG